MQPNAYRLIFGVLSFLLLFPACSGGDSNTGTPSHGGNGGGVPGSGGAGGTRDAGVVLDAAVCEQLSAAARTQYLSSLNSTASLVCQAASDCSLLFPPQASYCFFTCGDVVGEADISAVTAATANACDPYFAAGCPRLTPPPGCVPVSVGCDRGKCVRDAGAGGSSGSGGASGGTNDGGGGIDGRRTNDGGDASDGRRTNDGGGANDGGGGIDGRRTNDGGGGIDGRRTNDVGNAVDGSEPSYCVPCPDEAAAKVLTCPTQRPATQEDLGAICRQFLGASREVKVRLGGCAIPVTLPGCNATSLDPTVDVLSVDLIPAHGVDCQYSRATGALVGQSISNDSPRYCGNQAYVATTSGVTNPWCTAGGSSLVSVTCSATDGGIIDAPPDAPASSKCSACGADELCVGYYDGLCTPMSSHCVKVSAATRESILVKHQSCFMKPSGDEICENRDGGVFWGCGAPSCPNEPLVSDINCYGP